MFLFLRYLFVSVAKTVLVLFSFLCVIGLGIDEDGIGVIVKGGIESKVHRQFLGVVAVRLLLCGGTAVETEEGSRHRLLPRGTDENRRLIIGSGRDKQREGEICESIVTSVGRQRLSF